MRIRIVWEGKTKDAHLRALAADYSKRISRFCDIQIDEIKPLREGRRDLAQTLSPGERKLAEKLQGSVKVFLDERGKQWSSQEFAKWLGGEALHGAREVAFVIGGPYGFSEPFFEKADRLLSLSRMTLTHDWSRALLLEQIYRAFTILRGFPYAH